MTSQISEAKRARVLALHEAKVSIPDIMRRTKLSRRQVGYALRNVETPGYGWAKRWSKADLEGIITTLTRRLKRVPSLTEIGAELDGVSRQRVQQLLTHHGIAKPHAPGRSLSFSQRNARQTEAAKRAQHAQAGRDALARRDAKIVAMAGAGKSRAEIAAALDISLTTVSRALAKGRT